MTEGFNHKPTKINQEENPPKEEVVIKESQELASDIERRISEAEAYIKDHPEEENRYRLLINDMQQELTERRIAEGYSNEDEFKIAEAINDENAASKIFSGKDKNPETLQ